MTLSANLLQRLSSFVTAERFNSKGPLCVALVVTQKAYDEGLPLDPNDMLAKRGGQVAGLGRAAVQAVLERNGIKRILASEGGRTSRGSIENMQKYVALLNELHSSPEFELRQVEKFWIGEVRKFFAGKPFKFAIDGSRGLRKAIRDVVTQAQDRQAKASGTMYTGALIQHMVGAKLDCALGKGYFDHNSFSTSDAQSSRAGDFQIKDVAVHVTTSPTEAVIRRCQENLHQNLRPMIVTLAGRVQVAETLAENVGIADRVDVFEIEQFVALNLYEIAKFEASQQRTAIEELINRYNEIVEEFETDPSLKIETK